MTVEKTISMLLTLSGLFIQDSSKEHVAFTTEDRSMLTTDGKESVALFRQHDSSIFNYL